MALTEPRPAEADAAQLTVELAPADLPKETPSRRCPVCETAAALTDDFCQRCGLQLGNDRQHFSEQPSRWLAAVSDRGLVHPRNEDASATDVVVTTGPPTGVLVVADGVSAAEQSDLASLVAARAVRDELRTALLAAEQPGSDQPSPDQPGSDQPSPDQPSPDQSGPDPTAAPSTLTHALDEALVAGHQAILAQTMSATGASTTIATALVRATRIDGTGFAISYASIGDSRIYWLPARVAAARLLSQDDSVAELHVAAGVPRAEAERGDGAHVITGWIGHQAPELRPHLGELEVDEPGWLLLCTDGLWNYVSDPVELRKLLDTLTIELDPSSRLDPSALAMADSLVRWACRQGGRDNVTVALARVDGPPSTAPVDAVGADPVTEGHHDEC